MYVHQLLYFLAFLISFLLCVLILRYGTRLVSKVNAPIVPFKMLRPSASSHSNVSRTKGHLLAFLKHWVCPLKSRFYRIAGTLFASAARVFVPCDDKALILCSLAILTILKSLCSPSLLFPLVTAQYGFSKQSGRTFLLFISFLIVTGVSFWRRSIAFGMKHWTNARISFT